MVELFSFKDKVELEGFTLVLPTVAVGNVPQLTVDLLITSLDCKKVATIWHPAIVSSVGADPYKQDGPDICTACELYVREDLKLALIQLRSTINSKLATKFFADLKSYLLQQKFKNVLILASSFDYELHVVNNSKFYYISNNSGIGDVMKSVGVRAKEAEFNGKYLVHGAGFAVKLFETLDNLECTMLIKYVSEGDNRPDAIAMVEILGKFTDSLKMLNLKTVKFSSSWSCVFGGPPPVGIY